MTEPCPAANVVNRADQFLGAQVRALLTAPDRERAAAAELLAQAENELDFLSETVRFAVADGRYEDALDLIDRLRGLSFSAGGRAPAAVASCFALRRDAVAAELYEYAAAAFEREIDEFVPRSPAMRGQRRGRA